MRLYRSTYLVCIVLYKRMPSARPQIWIKSSLDRRSKSAPEKLANVVACCPKRHWFSHCPNWPGVESLLILTIEPLALLKSSFSINGWCCGVAGDKIFWSNNFMVVFDDDTLLIAIGVGTFGALPLNTMPSYFGMWFGEFISGDPESVLWNMQVHIGYQSNVYLTEDEKEEAGSVLYFIVWWYELNWYMSTAHWGQSTQMLASR